MVRVKKARSQFQLSCRESGYPGVPPDGLTAISTFSIDFHDVGWLTPGTGCDASGEINGMGSTAAIGRSAMPHRTRLFEKAGTSKTEEWN